MYSSIDMSYEAPTQGKSIGVLVGAAIGAVVGVACLAAATTIVPSNLYTATAVRSAVPAYTTSSLNSQTAQVRSADVAQSAIKQPTGYQGQEMLIQTPQTATVYSWAFLLFATVAGAVNGLFLWNNRRVAMAANTSRREALMAGAAAMGMAAAPAFAAYGEKANIFGAPKDVEQFFEIEGDGWSGILPGKYNSSKEREIPGIVARWEDNFDAVNNAYVAVREVGKNSITEFGSLDDVRNSIITPLLGKQAFEGPSISEGGFAPGRYANAAVLDQKEETKNGKTYYTYELLTRTADGNEGGRHQLFTVAASNGKLYIFKHQAGDKRWFKGLERPIKATIAAFKVK